ncbi:regulatory protein ArsR, partial [groundwater metagenome]
KGLGFVDFEDENKAKKAKKPTVDYDAVHVTIPISKGSAILA